MSPKTAIRPRRRGVRDRLLAFLGCQTRGETQAIRLLAIYQRLYRRTRDTVDRLASGDFPVGPDGLDVVVPAATFQRLLDEHYGVDHPTAARFRKRVEDAARAAEVLGGNGPG